MPPDATFSIKGHTTDTQAVRLVLTGYLLFPLGANT